MSLISKISTLVVISIFVIACGGSNQETTNATDSIEISGTVSYPQQAGSIVLEEVLVSGQLGARDTIELNMEDYTYSLKKRIDTPGIYRLNFYNTQFVNVLLDKDDIQVRVDGNARNGFVEISGSNDHKLLDDFQQFRADFQRSEEMQSLNTQFQALNNAGDQEGVDMLRAKYMELQEAHNQKAAQMILDMGTSLTALQMINTLDKDQYFDTYLTVAERFQSAHPNNQFVMQFVGQVENMKKLAIGMTAPDIALPNPDGDIVKLSSLRGNYVLVDFWAKWCKPCRAENPNVVRAYNKYNKKGFEVFGVSLDRRKEEWVQAIEEDGLHWTQVSDLKFWQSEAAKLYNVSSIPFALLLDKEGKIIAKNLRGKALDDKLAELLGE